MAEPGSGRAQPPDQQSRLRIRSDLLSTLFVEAGAGSGKTSELVRRVLSLVLWGQVELSDIAAITFTEKAGAELRDRIRSALEKTAAEQPGPGIAERCRRALDQLDSAAIGTLHSFAQRILTEHPIEAGLPLRIEVLDDVSSSVDFEDRFSAFRDQLLADQSLERTLLLLFAAGVRMDSFRLLARDFEENWDLVEDQALHSSAEPPSTCALLATVLPLVAELKSHRCTDPADKLYQRVQEIASYVGQLADIDDDIEALEALGPGGALEPPSFSVRNRGTKKAWDDKEAVVQQVVEIGERLEGIRNEVVTACAHKLGEVLARFTLASARERQMAGRLRFHDLLVLARALLQDPGRGPEVRDRLHRRYRRILLDEFQDTDPIQIELAVRIGAAEPHSAASGHLPWQEVEVAPGHLFVVGDPKQSIYRFRRADIATFLQAATRFSSGGGRVGLTANFRTAPPIIDWVNSTFGTLMSQAPQVDLSSPSQPHYMPLVATRSCPDVGPTVSVLGRQAHQKASAEDLQEAEAAEVAAAVATIRHEGWTVADGQGGWRTARLGDIAILVPARTSLQALEEALSGHEIAFRSESSSLVYRDQAVRDLLMVLRAVDDPTNRLHIVSALRTPLLACGDDDLLRFRRERHGHWDYRWSQPHTVPVDDPVRRGLEYLHSLYDQRHWLTPSELLERVIGDRRAMELGFTQGRPRDLWSRLRFVVDQARAWSGATGGTLRGYLSWVDRQAKNGAWVAEAVLPETDDDAVRIMTIHAAKGLEFPITILSGMSGSTRGPFPPAQAVFPPGGAVGYRFSGNLRSPEFLEWQREEDQRSLDERIRLLYVATTRARDHLVVSLHRKEHRAQPDSLRRTYAEHLVVGMGERIEELAEAAKPTAPWSARPPHPPVAPPPFDVWLAERNEALQRAQRPRTVAATALAAAETSGPQVEPDHGLQKRPRDLDLSPWLKGRYGSAVGRAVHGVLQTVDLGSGEDLEAVVSAQCQAEGVPGRRDEVAELVASALRSASLKEAASCPHWREVYVCVPVGDRLLEGYVDLLYRGPDGLVVVDYKTAGTSDRIELDRRLDAYRTQGASYALSVAEATGEPVARVTFLFLTPDGALERHLTDLVTAMAHTRELVAAGREVVVP